PASTMPADGHGEERREVRLEALGKGQGQLPLAQGRALLAVTPWRRLAIDRPAAAPHGQLEQAAVSLEQLVHDVDIGELAEALGEMEPHLGAHGPGLGLADHVALAGARREEPGRAG